MKVKIPIREIKVYQSDDGKQVEMHQLTQTFEADIEATEEEKKELEENLIACIYVGVTEVGIGGDGGMMGTQEIKFQINAHSIEEAFQNFEEDLNEFINEQQSKIIEPGNDSLII